MTVARTRVRSTLRWRGMDSNFQYADAVNLELEAEIYRMLSEVLPDATIVSIGHRTTLIALHQRHIEMEPGEGGIFEPTPRMGAGSFASAQP